MVGYCGVSFDIKPKMEIPLLALLLIGKSGAAAMVGGISAPIGFIPKMSLLKRGS